MIITNLESKKIYDYICSTVQVPKIINSEYLVNRNFNALNNSKDQHQFQYSWEFCGQDLSKCTIDLSDDEFATLSFDDNTIFSDEQQSKFHPQEIMQKGKQFSAELEELFKRRNYGARP